MLLFILSISDVQSQSLRHYQVESGLSNNAVMCSIQDQVGFMWFGSRHGLNRFDGQYFKTYYFDGSNMVRSLAIDKKGDLFAATEKKIYQYDRPSDTFKFVVSTDNYFIALLVTDNDDNIWFNASGKVSKYNTVTGQLISPPQWNSSFVVSLAVDDMGVVWAGTADGQLKQYQKSSKRFKSYAIFSSLKSFGSRAIQELKPIKNKIMVGTFKRGFGIFDQKTGSYRDVDLPHAPDVQLIFRSFLQVTAEELWIGCETGLYTYNLRTGSSSLMQKKNGDPFSLSDNVIYTLTKDREGGVWVGTYFGGLNYFPKQFTSFNKYYQNSSPYPLSGDIVRDLTQDKEGNLWICTEDAGLNELSLTTGRVSFFRSDGAAKSISYRSTHGVLAVGKEIWVATFEHGLNIIDKSTRKVIRRYWKGSKHGLDSNFPYFLYQTKAGKILVGTDNGLFGYDYRRDRFYLVPGFPAQGLYNALLESHNGTLWASLDGTGLLMWDPSSASLRVFKSNAASSRGLPSDKINSIFEDSSKNIWIATEAGVCRWDPKTEDFTRYGTRNGFPSDFTLSILEDTNKKLWISTTRGLVCFDTKTYKAITYTTANGLLSDQFNFNSAYRTRDNTLYFGSAKGLISFNPDQFKQDEFVPTVHITSLQVTGRGASSEVLTTSSIRKALYQRTITLKHDQSSLDIEFSALGYTAPQLIRYAYKLEGLSDHWQYITKTNKLNFPKLGTGHYQFRIMASSTSGLWNEKITTLDITILPPWWKTRLAIIIYVLASAALVYYSFAGYRSRLRDKNQRHLERLEIEREKEILETKIDFYTEVAHEIRTPLTLIKVPLNKIIRHTKGIESIANSLRIIGGNTDRLIELSNQLLDFRQTELKRMSYNAESIDVVLNLKKVSQNFSEQAKVNNLDVKLYLPDEPILIYADSEAFKKITYNLLSNAVKYANQKIIISVSFNAAGEVAVLFKNDGKLIPSSLREKIFEPFFRIQEADAKTGSGIGLALARSLTLSQGGTISYSSENEQFNVFCLTMPVRCLK